MRLHQPSPELLDSVPRWWFIICVGFYLCQPTLEVHILRLDQPDTADESRDKVEDREEDEGKVVGDKTGRVPLTLEEDGESTEEADDNDPDDGIPRREGVQLGCIREAGTINALSLETLVEPDISEADTEPGHQSGNSSHVREPSEDFAGAIADCHVCEGREEGRERDCGPWKSGATCPGEELRSLPGQCQPVQGA